MMPSTSQEEIPPPPPPPPSSQTPPQPTPHTVSTIKLPILKKREYDIWAMKMEHYLAHTDYPIWEIVARERERKARTTLLMAIPEDHLAKFHKMTDAKEMWDAIKSRFGGNDESKKMQKYILKQQFEGFSVSNTEGLHKGYDRFQSLLSQLEIHGAGVSNEDANKKFLRSLPSAWSQVSLIMRTKPGVDTLSFDDFTNEVSTAYCVPNHSGQNTKYEQTSSYSLLANQSSCPQLDHEDLEQIDEYDLEEMDLKWQVAMISMRMKKVFNKKTGHFARECRFKGTQNNKRKDAWNSGNKDGSRTGQKEDSKALVTVDGELCLDQTNQKMRRNLLMACNSSDSDTEVISCSNKCKESYANLKKLYDAQREQLSDASIEIKAYSQGLKKVKAQLVAHQQGQLWYEQKIKFMKIDLDDKTDVLTYHKKLLAEAQKEKEDLKAKVEKWHNSSKNLEPSELVSELVVIESNVESQPKVWSDAPIIEEYELDSEDEFSTVGGKRETAVKPSAGCSWRSQSEYHGGSNTIVNSSLVKLSIQIEIKDKGIVDSGCSKGHITGKGKIKTGKLDFEDVCFVKELQHFNLFSVSQMCDKKNKVLFTDSECLVLSPDFKLPDENQRIKREYSNARTSQQNGVAERKNRTLIEGARTMLADSFLPNTFWAEAVSTACYVLNRRSIPKGPTSGIRANLHAGQQEANQNAGTEDIIDAWDSEKEDESAQDCFVLQIWPSYSSTITLDLKTDEKREGPREEEQVCMDELERLKRQNMLLLQAVVGRHHFIRDAYEKKLIQVLKIHTDDNVADLLTKAFDVSRFQFLVVNIGMINP
ncbi:ribonuclease H-like domain-containing protein [Tanacetum coccineum]